MKSKFWIAATAALAAAGCGAEAESCTVVEQNGVQTMECPDGTSAPLPAGNDGTSCTIDVAVDGTRTLRCSDGTETPIEDGGPGRDGKDGDDGDDGRDGRDGTDGTNGRDGEDGEDGTDGASAIVRTEPEPPGATCPTGGTRIIAGIDRNGDGFLDSTEETTRTVICNGRNGQDGQDGSDGEDGEDGPAGPPGGDGQDGESGRSALVDLSEEAPGANCRWGGVRIDAGVDDSGDGVLDAAEIDDTSFVCNGPAWTYATAFDAEWDALGAAVQNLVGFRAQIAGAYDPFAKLLWRVRFTDAAGVPVPGIGIATGDDVADWRAWTGETFTDAQGEAILGGSGFAAGEAGLLVAGGAHVQWRITPPAVGMLHATVELFSVNDGEVLGSSTIDVQVAPVTTGVTLWGFGDLPATARNLAVVNTRIAPSVDPDLLVSWRYTLTDGLGAPVAGAALYYDDTASTGFDHARWTTALTTDAQGQFVREPAGVEARTLQLFRGANFPVSFALVPGDYTLLVELLDQDAGTVIESQSAQMTVAHLTGFATFLHFGAAQADTRSFVAIQARHATTASPDATVRWRVTLTGAGGVPVEGRKLYTGDEAQWAGHAYWTESMETDAAGQAWVGDAFPAYEAMTADGVILPFSVRFPAGTYGLQLELVDTATDTAVATHATTFVVQ